MNRIESAFKNKKAFIPFITAGYPNINKTEDFIYKMVSAGADLIEIGIPFSDPVAEGPVIQESSQKAPPPQTVRDSFPSHGFPSSVIVKIINSIKQIDTDSCVQFWHSCHNPQFVQFFHLLFVRLQNIQIFLDGTFRAGVNEDVNNI